MRKREKIEVFDSFLDKEILFGKDRAADDHHVPDSHDPDPLVGHTERFCFKNPRNSNSHNVETDDS